MTYKINKTDGSLLAEVVDSTVDQSASDLTLIGKNVSGFGEYINENFIKLLENFANTSAPNNPIAGQIWFDTAENRLKVYDGTGFRVGSGPIVSGTAPLTANQGDFWFDSQENQLYFYTGTGRYAASKLWKDTQGRSGFRVETILDTNNIEHVIVLLEVGQALLGIFSKDSIPFTPREAIPGFAGNIAPGFNKGTLTGLKFNVTANAADNLVDPAGNLKTTESFLSTEVNTRTIGTLTVQNENALVLGSSQNFEIRSNTVSTQFLSNTDGKDYLIKVKNGPVQTTAVAIRAAAGRVGIFNDSPNYTLDVAGSFAVSQQLMLPKYTTTARDARTLTSGNNGELIYNTTTNKVQAYANGTWVDLH